MSGPCAEVTASPRFCVLSMVEGLRVRPSEVWLCPKHWAQMLRSLVVASVWPSDHGEDMMFSAVPAGSGAGPAPPALRRTAGLPQVQPASCLARPPNPAGSQPVHALLLFPWSQAVLKRQLLPLHPRQLVGRFPVAYLIFIAWG